MSIRLEKPRHTSNLDEPWHSCVLCGTGATSTATTEYNRYYPQSMMVKYEGKWYCRVHFEYKFNKRFIDEAEIEVSDGEGQIED